MMAETVCSIMGHNGSRVVSDTGKKGVYKGVQKGSLYYLKSTSLIFAFLIIK